MAVEFRALGPEEWQERLDEAREHGGAVRFGSGWEDIDLDDPNLPPQLREMAEAIPAPAMPPPPPSTALTDVPPPGRWWGRWRQRAE